MDDLSITGEDPEVAMAMDEDADRIEAMHALQARRQHNRRHCRIQSADLYAGSNMFFYCDYCGACVAVVHEEVPTLPAQICTDCESMQERGWIDGVRPSFPSVVPEAAERKEPYYGPAFLPLVRAEAAS